MGKKHHKTSRRPGDLSPEQLERQALDDMAAARFRKARDAYKILCKQDREKYLPGLIEANRGLAEQLMGSGLVSEAEQVLTYLKTIAPPSSILATDVSVALKKQDWQKALDAALHFAKTAPAAHDERDRATVADALVLAFPNIQEAGSLPLSEASDLVAVVGALRCVSEERWEQAQELLRPLPRSSPFAAWKILVKGMIAFYTGNPEKSEALFAQLPPHGVPMQAANALRMFLGQDHLAKFGEPAGERAVRGAASLLNAPKLAPFLLRAEQAWRSGRHTDSYKEMRQAPGFPSDQPDLAGALSDFYFKAPFAMHEAAHEKYLEWFERLADSGQFKNDLEACLIFRLLGCAEFNNPFSEQIEHFWRMFLEYCPTDDPLTRKIASLALQRVATYYAQPEEADWYFFRDPVDPMRDAEGAISLLEESIASDPLNVGAYLKLLDVYESAEKEKDRNRLLNRMTQLFPKDKAVLLHAGRESLNRKAYVKGIEYLERAHALDALDPEVSETLVSAYTRLIRQYYEKKNVNKGRHTFDMVRRHAIHDKINFTRGLDFLQALQGVLETTFGDKGMGGRLMTAARECTRSLVALLFFAHGYSRLYQRKQASLFWAELLQQRAQVVTAGDRREVFDSFEYVHSLDETLDWSAETAFVRECLAPLGSTAFTREEGSYFMPALGKYPALSSLAQAIISEALRRDPDDPRFRLFSVLRKTRSPLELDFAAVDKIYHDAIRQGDTNTAKVAKAAMQTAESLAYPPIDDEEEEEEEEDEDAPFGIPLDELRQMRQMAAQMSDAEFEAFRKESAKEIPLPIFDLVMGRIMGKSSRRSQSAQSRRGTRKTDQLDLFNE
jgi:tetratricopeptide (TPR) repeat protein